MKLRHFITSIYAIYAVSAAIERGDAPSARLLTQAGLGGVERECFKRLQHGRWCGRPAGQQPRTWRNAAGIDLPLPDDAALSH